jgi:hypothetical protein
MLEILFTFIPSYQLYENKAYGRLMDRFGLRNVYVLSAGWGLIRADFLTPFFSPRADPYRRRRKTDRYDDFRMLPRNTKRDIVFFGGKDYLPLFCLLTYTIRSKKIVFFNSKITLQLNGCTLRRFKTATRTNWHYKCTNAVMDGTIRI